MDQPQPVPSNPAPVQPPAGQSTPVQTPYKTGEGGYNRESGKKTLAFVGVIIALIAILSVSSLMMMNKKSSVMVRSQKQQTQQETMKMVPSPTNVATESSDEADLDKVQIDSNDSGMQSLEQDADQL